MNIADSDQLNVSLNRFLNIMKANNIHPQETARFETVE